MYRVVARRPLLEGVAKSLRCCRVDGLIESAAERRPTPSSPGRRRDHLDRPALECTRMGGTAGPKIGVESNRRSSCTRALPMLTGSELRLHGLCTAGRTTRPSSSVLIASRYTLGSGLNTYLIPVLSRSARSSYQQIFLGSAHVVPPQGVLDARSPPLARPGGQPAAGQRLTLPPRRVLGACSPPLAHRQCQSALGRK